MHNPLPQLRNLQRFGLMFGLLLLVAQTTSLLHTHDLKQHSQNSHCELCLHNAAHDHGLTSSLLIVPVVAGLGMIISDPLQESFNSLYTSNYQSRAPPTFS